MVYWNDQDVIAALVGGTLIAISTTLNLLLYGRITGLSGAFNSIIRFDKDGGMHWKFVFLTALITIPAILNQIFGNTISNGDFKFRMFDENEDINAKQNVAAWIIGGILVGWGTKMANGCTSGHGVCGLPRFAPRSIIATMTFMAAGFALATLRYYYPFLTSGPSFGQNYPIVWRWVALGVLVALNLVAFYTIATVGKFKEMLSNYIFGLLFGLGLVIAGMCRISKIQNFLIIGNVWDPSLAFVMASAVTINLVTFNYTLRKLPKPLFIEGADAKFSVPPRGVIDARLVVGSIIFGLGWALGGLCPGPGVICFFSMTHAILWVPSLAIGSLLDDQVLKLIDLLKQKTLKIKTVAEGGGAYSEMDNDVSLKDIKPQKL